MDTHGFWLIVINMTVFCIYACIPATGNKTSKIMRNNGSCSS